MVEKKHNKWLARILALFFTLLLFFNANSLGTPSRSTTQLELTAVAENVPIKVNYDESKYYVVGYEEKTTVYLRGSNKVLLDMESNEQTRSFNLQVDLSGYEVGSYEVPITVKDLTTALTATLPQKTIHVTIEKRETRVFDVHAKVNDNLLKKGYTLDDIIIDPAKVEITSGDSTLNQIAEVIAPIEDDRDLSEDLSKRVDLLALDKDGNILSVIIVPTTVSMTVKIQAPSKSVPLKIMQSGSITNGISSFEFSSEYENVTIFGAREDLAKVEAIELYIDTSRIVDEEKESFTLQTPSGIKVEPKTVTVTIRPVKKEAEKSSTSARSSIKSNEANQSNKSKNASDD